MTEIRCPMCGKANPAELEVCQYCQARLKPLIISPSQEERPPAREEPQTPSEPAADPSDWLRGFREEDESGSESEPEPADLGVEQPEPFRPAPPRGSIQERLARAGSVQQDLPASEPQEESIEIEDEWSFEDQAFNDEPLEQAELPDWLASIRSRDELAEETGTFTFPEEPVHEEERDFQYRTTPPADEIEAGSESSEIETPDWMRRLEEEPPEPETEAQPGELPDWLTQPNEGFQGPAGLEDPWRVEEGQEQGPGWVEQTPGWLSDLSESPRENEASEDVFAAEQPGESEQLPDWLDDIAQAPVEPENFAPLAAAAGPEIEPELPLELPESAGELPEWLADIPQEGPQAGGTGPFEGELELDEPEEVSPFSLEGESAPDWLAAIPEEELSGLEGGFEEVPDWLSDLKSRPIEAAIGSGMVGVARDEELGPDEGGEGDEAQYPPESADWFGDEGEDEGVRNLEVEAGLAMAALPSWLEAMRPVEDVAPSAPIKDETEDHVESAGPLSGLRGALPAEPDVARLRKPPTYSSRLQVSDTQASHAEILQNIIKTEGLAQPIPAPPLISSQHVLRWVISAILILAVLLPLIGVGGQAPLPTFTSETAQTNRIIRDLPPDSRVLLGFDYEPGLSGEMDAVADAVIDHLILRGAFLTLVSTSPTGPIVAERFLNTTQAEHNYTAGNQYINLGYIPGGRTGLLSFAESPQRTLPYTLDGQPAWQTGTGAALPPLQGINALSDFDTVMVITEDPDTARDWIEQVQPGLGSGDSQTPLVMVISAQAEPMVRPYYQEAAGQVQGLVVGLRGGAAYTNLTGRENLPNQYWGAFGTGLAVVAITILVVSLLAVSSTFIAPKKKSVPEEAA